MNLHLKQRWMMAAGVCAAVFTGATPLSASPLSARIALTEAWIETQRDHEGIPGAAVAVVHGDSLVWAQGFGLADRAGGTPVTPDTAFRVCSISKLFTGIAAIDLVEEGRLALDRPLSQDLSWFSLDADEEALDRVTLRSILTHTAGLPEELDLPYYIEIDFPDFATVRREVPRLKLLHDPGSRYVYSNLGYLLAAAAVAEASGGSFEGQVRQRILDPLSTSHTAPDISALPPGAALATGYTIRSGDERRAFEDYPTRDYAAAGGFVSSADDLARLARWIFRLRASGGEEILSAASLQQMMDVQWSSPDGTRKRGLGFGYYDLRGQTLVGHGGYCPGFRSLMVLDPESEIGVIVLMNVNDASPYDWASAIFRMVAPALREDAAEVRTANASLSRYAGIYDRPGMPERVAIASDGRHLLVADLFADDPAGSLWTLEPVGGHAFAYQDETGRTYPVEFDLDEAGQATRYWRYSNYLIRVPGGAYRPESDGRRHGVLGPE